MPGKFGALEDMDLGVLVGVQDPSRCRCGSAKQGVVRVRVQIQKSALREGNAPTTIGIVGVSEKTRHTTVTVTVTVIVTVSEQQSNSEGFFLSPLLIGHGDCVFRRELLGGVNVPASVQLCQIQEIRVAGLLRISRV